MVNKAILIVSGVILTFSGCTFYSLAGSIPPHIKSISIPLVENNTAEYYIAETITDELLSIFTEENILRVENGSDVDSYLYGTITKLDDSPYTFSKSEAVSEYRLTIVMDIEWFDREENKSLIKKKYTGWGAYGLSGDASNDGIDNDEDGLIDGEDEDEFGEPRNFALKIAIQKIAEDILNEILTSW